MNGIKFKKIVQVTLAAGMALVFSFCSAQPVFAADKKLKPATFTTEAVVEVEVEDKEKGSEPEVTEEETVTNSTVSATSASPILTLEKKQSVNGGEPTSETVKAHAGDTVTYYLTVTNWSSSVSSVQTVSVVDTIPNGMIYIENSASGEPTISKGEIRWTVENLAAGQSVEVSYQAKIPDDAMADTSYSGTANASCYIEAVTESPKTGDENQPKAWLMVAVFSSLVISAGAWELFRLKRHG